MLNTSKTFLPVTCFQLEMERPPCSPHQLCCSADKMLTNVQPRAERMNDPTGLFHFFAFENRSAQIQPLQEFVNSSWAGSPVSPPSKGREDERGVFEGMHHFDPTLKPPTPQLSANSEPANLVLTE